MTDNQVNNNDNSKDLAAICGLFCKACSVYIGTQEDPERLQAIAKSFNTTPDEIKCDGCRADRKGNFCRDCNFISCTKEKGIDFCSECDEFPCNDLKEFQQACPHRNELWKDFQRISEIGYKEWMAEAEANYTCPECDTINSPYDISCRKCGNEPASEFITNNKESIIAYLKKQRNQ